MERTQNKMREDDTSEDRPNGAGIGQTVMSLPRKRNRNLKNKVGYHVQKGVESPDETTRHSSDFYFVKQFLMFEFSKTLTFHTGHLTCSEMNRNKNGQ